MFRTRDFILIFTSIGFLLVAIWTTVLNNLSDESTTTNSLHYVDTGDKEYSAEVYVPETVSREERLSNMRKKIAAQGGLTISAPEPTEEEDLIAELATSTSGVGSEIGVQQCSDFVEFVGFWPANGVKSEVKEGARIFYQELVEASAPPPVGTATPALLPEVQQNVLLQLSMPTFPMSIASCLRSDVIGVAQDGSLIRNNEAGLYGVFGSGTLIGYALDGFPIYGVGDVVADECGGAVVSGQYKYFLSTERETVLNCFSALPASL